LQDCRAQEVFLAGDHKAICPDPHVANRLDEFETLLRDHGATGQELQKAIDWYRNIVAEEKVKQPAEVKSWLTARATEEGR
jgi:hypothetical protein